MRLRTRPYAALVGAVLLALLLAACGSQDDLIVSPLLCIASDFPTSGPNAAQGAPAQNAVDLAVSQAALGGGYTLSVLHYGASNAAQGRTAMTDAANQDCALAFIGPADDTVAAAEMPIALNAGLPMLAPGLTNPALTNASAAHYYGYDFGAMHPADKQDTFFRLLPGDDAQAGVAARALQQAGATHIYVLDDGQPYGQSVGDFFTAAVTAQGGSAAGRASLPATPPADLTQTVAAIVAAHADGVFVAGGTTTAAAALRQALPHAVPLLVMGAAANDPAYPQEAGDAAEGTLAVTGAPDVASLTGAAGAQFVASYTQRFGSPPTPLAISAYDAAELAINAIHGIIASGNIPYRVSVLSQIASQRYTGIAGSYWFSDAGDNVLAGPVSVSAVRSGSWAVVQRS